MQRCVEWYGLNRPIRIADIGAASVNGSYREIFGEGVEYIGLDLEAAPGVDIVLDDPHHLPLDNNSIDLVISGQMLEHCAHFWRIFTEISRVLKIEGRAFIIAPSAGPIHRYPVDCYRFYPDAYEALADWSCLRLVDCWLDERGPWRDLVGVFQKGGNLSRLTRPPGAKRPEINDTPNSDLAAEVTSGQKSYLDVLAGIHEILKPSLYVEIGVAKGRSLRLCDCYAIGVDPAPKFEQRPEKLSLYSCTSDDFFFFHANEIINKPIDLAFIDGMHLAEYVYRDFMNLEKFMNPEGAIIIDDVLPNHQLQALRARATQVWCGDVWRFVQLLSEVRPDLQLTWLDTAPAGLLVVRRLKPGNRALWERYNPLVRSLLESTSAPLPQSVITREMAVAPTDDSIRAAIGMK